MRIPKETDFLGLRVNKRLGGFAGGWGRKSWGDGVKYKFSPCILFTSYSITALFMRHMLNLPSFFSTLFGGSVYRWKEFPCFDLPPLEDA